MVLVTVFIEGAVFYGAFAFVGAYLHGRFGLSYSQVGLLLIGYGAGGLVFALTVRRLVGLLGERGLALYGSALIAVGFVAVAAAPRPLLVSCALAVMGLGFYMLHNTLQVNATQMAPEARGLGVSAFASAFFLGQSGGAWIGGRIVDSFGYASLFVAAALIVPVLAAYFVHHLQRRR